MWPILDYLVSGVVCTRCTSRLFSNQHSGIIKNCIQRYIYGLQILDYLSANQMFRVLVFHTWIEVYVKVCTMHTSRLLSNQHSGIFLEYSKIVPREYLEFTGCVEIQWEIPFSRLTLQQVTGNVLLLSRGWLVHILVKMVKIRPNSQSVQDPIKLALFDG